MNSEPTKKLMSFYRAASRYGLDVSDEMDPSGNVEDWDGDKEGLLTLVKSISPEDFFKLLYLSRFEEAKIRDAIVSTARLLCVVGPKGSGKTTVVRKVLGDFTLENRYRVIIDLDVRRLQNDPDFYQISKTSSENEASRVVNFFNKQAVNVYYSEYFNYSVLLPESEKISKLALYAFVMVAKSNEFRKFAISKDRLKVEYSRMTRRPLLEPVAFEGVYAFLAESIGSEVTVRKILYEMDELLELPHLVLAAAQLWKAKHQVIWYDNLDQLDGMSQARVFEHLKVSHLRMPASVVSVICIREENIKHYVQSEQSAPSYSDFVVISPAGQTGAIGLGVFDENAVREIVGRRLSYAFSMLESIYNKMLLNQDRSAEKFNLPVALRRELSDLSERLFRIMWREKALQLTNQSLREFLSLHSATLDRYRLIAGDLRRARLENEDWFLATLFLRWLRRYNSVVPIGIYEFAEFVWEWKSQNDWGVQGRVPACVLEHVVATGLWNLESEQRLGGRPVRPPSVQSLLARLAKIGYSQREQVMKVIFSLYRQGEATGNIVDFCTQSIMESEGDIKDNHLIFLTYRGKCLSSFTCNTFGFSLESYLGFLEDRIEPVVNRNERRGIFMPAHSYKGELIWAVVDFLCDLASMYAEGLRQIGKRMKNSYGADWLSLYRSWFGIPGTKKQSANKKGTVASARNQLHFEAIISSLHAHFSLRGADFGTAGSGASISLAISSLKQAFEKEIHRIVDDCESPISDFRGRLVEMQIELPKRRWHERSLDDFIALNR